MPTQWESLANEHILGIAPYEPGKPIEELERELGIHDAIKLASNENPLPPSERVQKAIIGALASLNRYPDGGGFYLRQALAKKHGVTPEHIMLGNGSNELIELLVHAFMRPGDEAVVPHPSFVVYPTSVQAAGGIRVVVMLRDYRLDLEAMGRAVTPLTKLVFIANPNNPTATMVAADEVERFMARMPDRTIVVFDEAYVEFAQGPDFPDSLAYMKQGRKVVVLRTFSKAASLAGLRVGYGVADPDAVALLNRIRPPFNVNSLAQAAALAALDDEPHILECVRRLEAARRDGAVDRVTTDLAAGLRGADFVLLAAPVGAIAAMLADVWRAVALDATLTDVGSAKAVIVREAERLADERPLGFVGSHPMAGSEQSGYGVARADLFRGATVVVTPTEGTELGALKRVTEFWEALGARVSSLDPEAHDRTVAAISHLPHLIACALVDGAARVEPSALELAARGFRDTTRIAAGDPDMWTEIFLANRDALSATVEAFREALADLQRAIDAGQADALRAVLARIKATREQVR